MIALSAQILLLLLLVFAVSNRLFQWQCVSTFSRLSALCYKLTNADSGQLITDPMNLVVCHPSSVLLFEDCVIVQLQEGHFLYFWTKMVDLLMNNFCINHQFSPGLPLSLCTGSCMKKTILQYVILRN